MTRISAAESHIMEALWRDNPLSADEIVGQVGPAQNWGEATVKTLINRLLKKKALVSRAEYVTGESQGLLDRLFGGELAPLVAHYAKHRPLAPDEVARLKRLIEDLDDDDA